MNVQNKISFTFDIYLPFSIKFPRRETINLNWTDTDSVRPHCESGSDLSVE